MDERLIQASDRTTVEEAEAQHPLLDASKPAASEERPHGEDEVVPAQTPEEVEAQYVNRAGGPNPTQEGDANAEDAGEEDDGGGQYDAAAADVSDAEDGEPVSGGADADDDGFADALDAIDEDDA